MNQQQALSAARNYIKAMNEDALPIYIAKLSDGSWEYTFQPNPHGTHLRVYAAPIDLNRVRQVAIPALADAGDPSSLFGEVE